MKQSSIEEIIAQAQGCTACINQLPLKPRPVFQAHSDSRILIVGQAPGIHVHESGIPWHDASGERLRQWLGVSSEIFYDRTKIAILPIGFCYPGTGVRGDLPPRKECFDLWHYQLTSKMPKLTCILLLGAYAQSAYLKGRRKNSLTETVRAWKEYAPKYVPLPHPSPLNNIWLHKNRWFEDDVLPSIKKLVSESLNER